MQTIGAVILAAGASSRLGQPKQLIQFRGQSLLRRSVEAARNAGCDPIVVVLGSDSTKIRDELEQMRATLVENKNWERGIGTSIRSGVQKVIDKAPNVEAIVLLTCDQPFVDARAIEQLVALHAQSQKAIVASNYSDTLGVPALFDRSCFPEMLALDDESGAKPIILADRDRIAEFLFPDAAVDIDTTEDARRLKNGV